MKMVQLIANLTLNSANTTLMHIFIYIQKYSSLLTFLTTSYKVSTPTFGINNWNFVLLLHIYDHEEKQSHKQSLHFTTTICGEYPLPIAVAFDSIGCLPPQSTIQD